MTNRGRLAIELTCPEGHGVGQLMQDAGQQGIGIQLADAAREEWPRGGDKMFTYLTCPGCGRRVYGSTETIRERATWLSESESDWEGRFGLRYIEDGLA
jgi:hypothetical protein